MTNEQKKEITKISKQFASAFKDTFGLNGGTGWLIVDPLSGYLNSIGYENKLDQIPPCGSHPQVLVITFSDGTKLIPSGKDLKPLHSKFKNWQWL